MSCTNCGSPLASDDIHCTTCGAPTNQVVPPSTLSNFPAAPPLIEEPHSNEGASRYAPWSRRVLAALIDGLFVGVPAFALAAYVLFINGTMNLATTPGPTPVCTMSSNTYICSDGTFIKANFVLLAIGSVVLGLAWAVYTVVVLASERGATPGMRAMKIRIVDAQNHGRISLGRSILRVAVNGAMTLVGRLVTVLGIVPLLNDLWPLWDKKNQTLTDKIARTVALDQR